MDPETPLAVGGDDRPFGPLSKPYRDAVRILVKNACVAISFGIFLGLLSTEIRMTIPYSQIPPGVHLEAVLHLELVHGHAITMLFLVPLGMAAMLVFARAAGGREIDSKLVPRIVWLYLYGAWSAVALLLVRGLQVAYHAKSGETDFDVIDERVLYSKPFRVAAYIFSHVPLTAGVLCYMYVVWQSVRRKPLAPSFWPW